MIRCYLITFLMLLFAAATARAQTGGVYPAFDAVVDSAFPDSTIDQSASGNLFAYVRYENGSGVSRVQSLVAFDLSGLTGQQVESASFSIRGKVNEDAFTDLFELQLFSARSAFDPDTVTAANAPRRGGRVASLLLNTDSGRRSFTNRENRLADYLNEQVRLGQTMAYFYIRSAGADSTAGMWIGGADNGSFAPLLEYSVTPQVGGYALADAVTDSALPDSVIDQANFNNNLLAYRVYENGEAVSRVQSYVSFDISGLNGRQVTEADLSIRGKVNEEAFAENFILELRSLRDAYDLDSLTANNEPRSRRTLGTLALNTSSARRSFVNNADELVNYINTASLNGETEIGFLIRSTGADSTAGMFIGGAENGSFGPILNYRISPEVEKYSIADAVTDSAFPDSVIAQSDINNNLLAYRTYENGEPASRVQSFVLFDISDLAGRKVSQAALSFRGKVNEEEFADDFILELRSLRDDWDPDSTTASNQPRSRRTLGTAALTTSSARQSFVNNGTELVDYLNTASLNGETTIGFLIRSTGGDSTASMFIGGTDNGSFGPILTYETSNERCSYGDADAVTMEMHPDSVIDQSAVNGNLLAYREYGDETFRTQSYVVFSLEGLAGKTAEAIDLSVRAKVNDEAFAGAFDLELRGVRDDFDPDTISWNTAPRSGSLLGTLALDTDSGRKSFTPNGERLNDYVTGALRGGETEIGFLIRSAGADSTTGMFIGGVANGSFGPILGITHPNIFTLPNDTATVVEDAYVAEATPDDNFEGVAAMQVARDTLTGNDREAYLQFPLGDNRTSVVTAVLRVRASQENSGTILDDFFIEIYGTDGTDWDEDTLTWNNRPAAVGDEPLFTFNVRESGNYAWNSEAMTEYVRQAIRDDRETVSFVVRGRDNTPGSNVWVSGKEFVPAELVFDYRRLTADPVFLTASDENYVPSVDVELNSPTPGATIYYTLDGSNPDESATPYDGPVTLTDTTTITAIAFAEGFAASQVVSATYNVAPIGVPRFTPSDAVEYTDDVVVTIDIAPADAIIVYSLDGSAPITPYTEAGVLITETTTIRAQGISPDGMTTGPIAEATYTIVETVAGTGTGPGGVGAADNTVSGQPENALWLAANTLDATDGEDVVLWKDQSGNGNDAFNTYAEGGDNRIPNTGERQQPAPTFVAAGPNGLPTLRFGTDDGSETPNRTLVIDDADNLDGGAGLSLFVVMKRNQLFTDFAGIVQKRDITGGAAAQSWILELHGGANPNKMQFVLERQTFLGSTSEFNAEDYYIVNTEIQGDFGQGIFRNNGAIENLSNNNLIVPGTDAPVIIGGFQPVDIAEVILYKTGLNAPQNVIVHNYLATKYGLALNAGDGAPIPTYANTAYTKDLIGVGMDTYLSTATEQEHRSAKGGGLRIDVRSGLATDSYLMAAHDGTEVTSNTNPERYYNLEVFGSAPNVTMSFDFADYGLDLPAGADMLRLWYSDDDGDNWSDLGLTGTVSDGTRIGFNADAPAPGLYAVSTAEPTVTTGYVDLSEDLRLFPVPTGDRLNLSLENSVSGPVQVSVVDALGRRVATLQSWKTERQFQAELQLAGLARGFYTLQVIQNDRYRAVRRFLKQ